MLHSCAGHSSLGRVGRVARRRVSPAAWLGLDAFDMVLENRVY
jgi:hypothetical protein